MPRLRSSFLILLVAMCFVAVGWWAVQRTPGETNSDENDVGVELHSGSTSETSDPSEIHTGIDEALAENRTVIDSSIPNRLVVEVIDERGLPVPDVEVLYRPIDHARIVPPGGTDDMLASINTKAQRWPQSLPLDVDAQRYAAHRLAHGAWRLDASAPDHETAYASVEIDGSLVEVTIELVRRPSISGIVVDPSGLPIASTVVRAQMIRSATRGEPAVTLVQTDPDGRFHAVLSPGLVELSATSHAGFLASTAQRFELSRAEQRSDFRLEVRNGATIRGMVLDSSGVARARCAVRLVVLDLAPSDRRVAGALVRAKTTNADGQFAYSALPTGTYLLVTPTDAWTHKGIPSEDAWPQIPSNRLRVQVSQGEQVDVVLRGPESGPLRLFGTIERGGAPQARGSVSFLPEGGDLARDLLTTGLNADGAYELHVPASGSGLWIFSPIQPAPVETWIASRSFGSDATTRHLSLPDANEFRFDFDLPSGAIAGRAIGLANPSRLLSVAAVRVGEPLGTNHFFTARGENFLVDGLAAGTYDLRAYTSSVEKGQLVQVGTARGVAVTAGATTSDVVIQLVDSATVTIEFEGLPDFGDVVWFTARTIEGTVVASDRQFVEVGKSIRIDAVPLGPLTFEAHTAATTCDPLDFTVESDATQIVTLAMQPAFRLPITTLDANGNPAFATVRVLDARGNVVAGSSSSDSALAVDRRETHQHDLGPLAPGTFRIEAREESGLSATLDVEFHPDTAPLSEPIPIRFTAH